MPAIETVGPPYQQIAEAIREQVTSGDLGPGDRVPGESELRESWGVSKATVRRAVALLKSWGVVETKIGSGTRVVDDVDRLVSGPAEHSDRLRRGLSIYGPGERSERYAAGIVSSAEVPSDVLQALGLPSPSPELPVETTTVVKRARVMFTGDRRAGVCVTWFSHPLLVQQPGGDALVERLTDLERIPEGTSRLVLTGFGLDAITDETIRVGLRSVPAEVAGQLDAAPGETFLRAVCSRRSGEYPVEVDEWWRREDVVIERG